ncbi:hypothetical protein MRX96_030646 [Rhipicephalus microplus]
MAVRQAKLYERREPVCDYTAGAVGAAMHCIAPRGHCSSGCASRRQGVRSDMAAYIGVFSANTNAQRGRRAKTSRRVDQRLAYAASLIWLAKTPMVLYARD